MNYTINTDPTTINPAEENAEYAPTPIIHTPVAEEDLPEWLQDEEDTVEWNGQVFSTNDFSDAAAKAVLGL